MSPFTISSFENRHARSRSGAVMTDRDSDQDETPLLYKDKEVESGGVSTKWRSKPRVSRRLLLLVLTIATLVCGGLALMSHVPGHVRKTNWATPDLSVRLRLLYSRMEEHYIPSPGAWRTRLALPPIKRLIDCVEAKTCSPSEGDIVILASTRFAEAREGAVSGENIWAASTIRAFENMNTTLFHTSGAMDTLLIYQHVPELVKLVIWEGSSLNTCEARNGTAFELETLMKDDYERAPPTWQGGSVEEQGCMVRDDFPEGIPYWKSLVFHFWGDPKTPLGREFTLAPWDFSGTKPEVNRYLGFSIEDHCMTNRYYPPEERKHQALILGKLRKYFEEPEAWITPDLLRDAVPTLPKSDEGEDFKLISTAIESWGDRSNAVLPKPIISVGFQTQANWTDLLARSKVLIGLGWPAYSPSPFDALCVGVPFINPIQHLDLNNPEDRSGWLTQNDALLPLDPPYVYHVRKDNATQIQEALRSAIETPIPRYIPENMKAQNVLQRHRDLLYKNWYATGEAQLVKLYGGNPKMEYLLLRGATPSTHERIKWGHPEAPH